MQIGNYLHYFFEVNVSIIQDGSTPVVYKVTPQQITRLIAQDLGVDVSRLTIRYTLGTSPSVHPMDHCPETIVTGIEVTYK